MCCGGAGDPENYEKCFTKYVAEVLVEYPDVKTVAM